MKKEKCILAKRSPLDFKLNFINFKLQYMLEDLFYHYRYLASEKMLDCFLVVPDTLKKTYKADPLKIEYILSTLIAHCIEATQKGRVDISVRQGKSFGTSTELKFLIEDTGTGIKLESKAAQQKQEAGANLEALNSNGLNKVFKMIEYIGGSLKIESSGYQNGIRFNLVIPLEMVN